MPSWGRRATKTVSVVGLLFLAAACRHKSDPVASIGGGPVGSSRSPERAGEPSWTFESVDDRPVSSATLRGKPTVLAFVSSDDLPSQAQAGFLAAMAKNDGDKVNYVLIAIEAPAQRELVQGFQHFFESKFGVSLRTAMADADTLTGAGPFGDVTHLTVLVFDPAGKMTWRRTGLARVEEIRAALGRM
jgi:hypothetical protein